jgi:hypothetical protein
MAGFLQEQDGSFSIRRFLALLSFMLGWGGSLVIAIIDHTSPEIKWIILALLSFSTVLVLILLGYTTMADLKSIAQVIKGKEGE